VTRHAQPGIFATLQGSRQTSQFYLGDCLDVFRTLPTGSVDVIVE
jgi:hypothetical protein